MTPTFGAPGDANNPIWTWLNQNSATAIWSNGMLSMASASRGGDNLNCLIQTAPATPYTFVTLMYTNINGVSSSANAQHGIVFYESGTGKAMTWGTQAQSTSTLKYLLTEWTGLPGSGIQNGVYPIQTGVPPYPVYLKIQADGTNINFSSSPDGVVYQQQFTQAKAAFFTTAPDRVGICIDNNNGPNSADFDYFRRTQ